MNPWGLLIVAVGVFSFAGGYYDWNWFMKNSRAKLVVALLTRTGARIFYALLGIGIAVVGILITLGALPVPTSSVD